jgi:predicted transglutaminase-like cysteine proteinase
LSGCQLPIVSREDYLQVLLGFSKDTMKAVIVTFIVFLAAFSGETNAFAGADAPASSVMIAVTHDKAQDQTDVLIHDDAQAQAKLAALHPREPSIKSPTLAEPFGLIAVPVETGELLTKWSSVEADIRAESEVLAHCRENAALCPSAARAFLAIVAEGRVHTGRARIGVINRAINLAIRPMSDLAQWGVEDRWTAPLATFTSGFGDCEDYAIAKYVALTEAGVPAEDVRFVIVHDLAVEGGHAVVAVRLDDHWILLDNRWMSLVDNAEMQRVIPLFVLDHDGVRQFAPAIMRDVPQIGAAQFH